MRMCHNVICGLSEYCILLPYLINGMIFGGGGFIEHKIYVKLYLMQVSIQIPKITRLGPFQEASSSSAIHGILYISWEFFKS